MPESRAREVRAFITASPAELPPGGVRTCTPAVLAGPPPSPEPSSTRAPPGLRDATSSTAASTPGPPAGRLHDPRCDKAGGEADLADRSCRPRPSPHQLDPALVTRILILRRERKGSARRIHHHLAPKATGCVFAPWAGGCTGPGSPGCVISSRTERSCAIGPSASSRRPRGPWCTWTRRRSAGFPRGMPACSRPGFRERTGSQTWPRCQSRLHVPALGGGRVHPAGLHGGVGE